MEGRMKPALVAEEIWHQKYCTSKALFLCGSVLRGEATRFSDLDIVVVFEKVDYAWRESFCYQDWPVEAFVHDLGTLKYFFYEMDVKSGCPSLPQMVAEGITIPQETEFSESLRDLARKIIDGGPPMLSIDEINRKRYGITDLVDDIREPRSTAELMATGTKLFEELADFYFRVQGLWSATGKTVIRRFNASDPALGKRYEEAFRQLFCQSDPSLCIAIAEEILAASGGLLFDGYRLNAPASWRLD